MKKEIKFEFLIVQALQYCINHNISFLRFVAEALKTKLQLSIKIKRRSYENV